MSIIPLSFYVFVFSEGFLDARYLQKAGDGPARGGATGGRTSPAPISIHFGGANLHGQPPGGSTNSHMPPGGTAGSTRLSKDVVIGPAATSIKSGQQPPLSSAYFPGQTKVS